MRGHPQGEPLGVDIQVAAGDPHQPAHQAKGEAQPDPGPLVGPGEVGSNKVWSLMSRNVDGRATRTPHMPRTGATSTDRLACRRWRRSAPR